MENAQALLDAIVALVQAERGFIVLRDPSTNTPTDFAASYNFDAAAAQKPIGAETGEEQYIWESLPYFFTLNQAGITINAVRDSYYYRLFRQWPLRSVLTVPFKDKDIMLGLLWCDQRFIDKGAWTEQDLQNAIALVQRSDTP